MHENKFEKQVREKMDQLDFDPSDAIWAEVDREINREKKRRRPLFWIFFFSGLVLAGGGIYVAKHTNPTANRVMAKPEFPTSRNQDSLQESKLEEKKTSTEGTVQNDYKSEAQLRLGSDEKSGSVSSQNHQIFTSRRMPLKRETGMIAQQKINSANPGEPAIVENKQKAGENKDNKDKLTEKEGSALANRKEEKVNQSLSGNSVSALKTVKNNNHQIKTSSWSIEFTGSAGISKIDQGLFQPANAASNSYFPSNSPAVSSPGARTIGTSAEIHSGFSFGLGVMVNRKLSKRVSLSTGLGYRYFSTKISTGNQVDSTLYLYTTANSRTTSVGSFYRIGNGQEHTNQYQFIELPVNLNLQLNRNVRTPVSWEAGFSLAWMIGNNALLFDPNNNVYFVNKQLFNKTQWNASTAILVGFPVYDHIIQLGPQLQYGLTGLLKTGTVNPGHLVFFGLKMTFIP